MGRWGADWMGGWDSDDRANTEPGWQDWDAKVIVLMTALVCDTRPHFFSATATV
jgi:hypothetical protein